MAYNLNKAISRYKKTGKGLDLITQHINIAAYCFAEQNRYCREDDCSEFLLSFYPRIDGVIRRYRPSGLDFKTYLQSCFIWHMKSYLATRIRQKRQEEILYNENCESLMTEMDETEVWEIHEEEPEALLVPDFPEEENPDEMLKDSLHLLLLALKCANEVNDRLINLIASRIGTHSAFVFHFIEILRTTMGSRTRRIQFLVEKRRRVYFRIHYYHELLRSCRDRFHAAELERKIRKEKRRYETVNRILSNTPKSPSHSDIARILGLPKGTVDSGFFYIRRTLKRKKQAGGF
ncbi:MAG: hypothetical protein LBT33_02330 [Spirochaetia bacterium]|jgi:DNA-directed RNA polymerase specialized sigma24 family protein|nr:hypothetical protein [Spirochaetia bacterium]